MKKIYPYLFLMILGNLNLGSLHAQNIISHVIRITINPGEHSLEATDTITFGSSHTVKKIFLLHKDLSLDKTSVGAKVKALPYKDGPYRAYEAQNFTAEGKIFISYRGKIFNKLQSMGSEYARGFQETVGLISSQGIYLSGNSCWYPVIEGSLVTAGITVILPRDWDAVSQGKRLKKEIRGKFSQVRWEINEPQDELYLIGGKFHEYLVPGQRVTPMVFLQKPDPALAEKYLDATIKYLAMYEKLIGPYPYGKFALVENFWESGYGMPSFTLLGPKIIRFPFIIQSSYPHEILHNWWGNSVYPDYSSGNWSEGLTAYLSDYLLQEIKGSGTDYRLNVLQKYADYISHGNDFPLAQFQSRHSSSSEVIGYGKSMMFFHMLRLKMGDAAFLKGLADFYAAYRFKVAGFKDIQLTFEKASGKSLAKEFNQWLLKTGAPELKLSEVHYRKEGTEYILNAKLAQTQTGESFSIQVPVAVTMENRGKALWRVFTMAEKIMDIQIPLPARPVRLDLDPEFDIFRKLARQETPPALSQILGSENLLLILPRQAARDFRLGYSMLAKALAHSGPKNFNIKWDSELTQLPEKQAVIVFGWENKFRETVFAALRDYDFKNNPESLLIENNLIPKADHGILLTARNPREPDIAQALIATQAVKSFAGLARKLPHYHKYSYLAFQGKEPENTIKGRWPARHSPMTFYIPEKGETAIRVGMAELPGRKPLTTWPGDFSKERIKNTINFLTARKLNGRFVGSAGNELAAKFIARKFREAGLLPFVSQEKSYFQTWRAGINGRQVSLANIAGIIPGEDPSFKGKSLIIGAHYDHLDSSKVLYPGADDNASGVALLIELATALRYKLHPKRDVILVAFTAEEEGKIGSQYFVKNLGKYAAKDCIGMINLDTIGRLGKGKLLILGSDSAREWPYIFQGAGYLSGIPLAMVREDLDSSDHKSFIAQGIPAVQLFSGPHPDYHKPTDTSDKIDNEGLAKLGTLTREVLQYLALRIEPLTSNSGSIHPKNSALRSKRRVSLGTIPDFSYQGKGCRISGVTPDSPAARAGLKANDIIMEINGAKINGIRGLSQVLKNLQGGEEISVQFLRQNQLHTVRTRVGSK